MKFFRRGTRLRPFLLASGAALAFGCGGSDKSTSGGTVDGGANASNDGEGAGGSGGTGASGQNGQLDAGFVAGSSGDDSGASQGPSGSSDGGNGQMDGGSGMAAPAMLGAYRWGAGSSTPGVGGPAAHATYETWLGTDVLVALDFAPGADWTNQEGPAWSLGPYDTWVKQRAGNTLVYTVQMVLQDYTKSPPVPTTSLEECAAGTDNAHWAALATSLVSHGLDRSILRLGHEFNGNWYPWNAIGRASTYISCFQQMVTSMRAVSGSHLRFNWCPGAGVANMPAETAYPGDDYVDVVGVDLYDPQFQFVAAKPYTDADRTKGWAFAQTGDHMLSYWRDFAKAHGKPLSFPEWGVDPESGQYPGPGDDTIYVQGMHDFILAPSNNVLFASYFDVHASDGDHQLSPGVKGEPGYAPTQYPNSAALFRTLFGK